MISDDIKQLAEEIGKRLNQKHWRITTAESCTGGLIAAALTEVAGSSAWFEQGIVSYSNDVKIRLLDVQETTLHQYGAVSEEVAKEMAIGAQTLAQANIALSVTGVAGPGGGSPEKPVGMVCFAWAIEDKVMSVTSHFSGSRQDIRGQSLAFCLNFLLQNLE